MMLFCLGFCFTTPTGPTISKDSEPMLALHRTSGLLAVCLLAGVAWSASAQTGSRPAKGPEAPPAVAISVVDENGVAVPSARVVLEPAKGGSPVRCETDFTGHCNFRTVLPGEYRLRVEKQGFYALSDYAVDTSKTPGVDVRLVHLQEVREVVN